MPSETANFEANIKRWSAYMPGESEEIKKVSSQRITLCKTEKGLANLKTEHNGQTFFFHDPIDPLGEANRWVATLDLSKADVVFVYGVGLGYYYDALIPWLRGNKKRYLAFIEDDPEVICRLMESDRAQALLQDSQVRLFYIADLKNGVGRVSNIAVAFMGLQFKVSAIQLYLRQKAPSLMRLHTMLSFLMKMYEVTHSEYRTFSVAFFLNYYLNLFTLPTSYLGSNLWGKWKNIPAIICGAGPSLHKNIDVLKTLQDKALILAGSTSINALNAAGISPHLGVGIDPNPPQLMRVVSNSSYQLPYFCSFRLNSFALHAIHGDHIYVNSGESYDVANWIDNKIGIESKGVLEGYNVVNFALSLATILGCNPIIVVGVDLAYSEDKSYAPLPPIHPLYFGEQTYTTKSPQEDLITRKDIHGKSIFTLWKWMLESVWYSKYALEFPAIEIINSTEGGIGFPGIENIPLKEAAEKHLQKDYDFEGLLHASIQQRCQMPPIVTEDKIASVLKILQSSMLKCSSDCDAIAREYRLIIANIAEGKTYPYHLVTPEISKEILALDQEEAYQHVLSVYNNHLMNLMQREIQKLELDKEWLNADEISQESAELHAVRFSMLKEAAISNSQLIDNALNAYESLLASQKSHPSISQEAYPVQPIEPLPDDCYSIENGILVIKDGLLGIDIREEFSGTVSTGLEGHEYYLWEGCLHGPSTYKNHEGRILSTTWYYRGKKVGRCERYYDDGTLYSINRYAGGQLHGPQDYYYRDGIVRSRLNYKEGEFDGPLLLFFPNGQLKREINYKMGKKEGLETLWNSQGAKIGEFTFADNLPCGRGSVWSPSGVLLKEISFDNEPKEGKVKLWNTEGEAIPSREEQGKDYFELVVAKMELLSENLSDIATSITSLAPLLEKESNQKGNLVFKDIQKDIDSLKEKINHLLELNIKLKKAAGISEIDPQKEALWKTPTTQEMLHSLIEQMVEQLQSQIVIIKQAFIDMVQSFVNQK